MCLLFEKYMLQENIKSLKLVGKVYYIRMISLKFQVILPVPALDNCPTCQFTDRMFAYLMPKTTLNFLLLLPYSSVMMGQKKTQLQP